MAIFKKQALNMPQVHRARLRPSLTGWVTGWVFTFSCAHKKKRPGYVPLNPIYIYINATINGLINGHLGL